MYGCIAFTGVTVAMIRMIHVCAMSAVSMCVSTASSRLLPPPAALTKLSLRTDVVASTCIEQGHLTTPFPLCLIVSLPNA